MFWFWFLPDVPVLSLVSFNLIDHLDIDVKSIGWIVPALSIHMLKL